MKRITTLTITCFLVTLISVSIVTAQGIDGPTVLKKMLDAEKKVSFTAHQVTTIARKPAVTSEQIIYKAGNRGMRMEYIEPPGLRGEVMADDGKTLVHYIPKEKVARKHPSRLAIMGMRTGQAGKAFSRGGFQVNLVGKDKIAGRNAYVIEVRPKMRRGVPARKFWVDTEKWIKLKTEDIAPDGTVTSMSYYTKIDFVNDIPNAKFHIDLPDGVRIEQDRGDRHSMSIEQARQKAGFRVLAPSYLPSGFKAAGATVMPFRHGQLVVVRFSDGVSSFSLFQTPGRMLNPKFLQRLHEGPVQPGKGIYSWRQGNLNFTIIGPAISSDQMHRIAASVK